MISVIIPFIVIILIMLLKKIPKIGGDVRWALVLGALVALLIGGVYSPVKWFQACFVGLTNVSFVLWLILFGSLFSEVLVKDGGMATFLDFLRAAFGKTPKGLLIVMMVFLIVAGSLFGDATAAVTVIGFLGIRALVELQMKPEQITAALVMGSAMGSIMPPISQASVLACQLVGIENEVPVLNITYITVGITGILMCLYASRWVKIKSLPAELMPKETVGQILKAGWGAMVPFVILFVIVVFQSAGINFLQPINDALANNVGQVPILSGFTNKIVLAVAVCFVISFFYKPAREKTGAILKDGLLKSVNPLVIMVCAAFLVGAFRAGGQVEAMKVFAGQLNAATLKIGGALAMALTGMITGLQSSTQTTIFTTLGPAWISQGVSPVHAAVAGAHLAMAGQGLPPADMLTFLTCGLVGGVINKEIDPLKSMMYSMPQCILFVLIGILFLFI